MYLVWSRHHLQGMSVEDLIVKIIELVGLGGEPVDYCLVNTSNAGMYVHTQAREHARTHTHKQTISMKIPTSLLILTHIHIHTHTGELRLDTNDIPCYIDCKLRLEDAPSLESPQLIIVPIHYGDLKDTDLESITLFADSTTRVGYVMCTHKIIHICTHTHTHTHSELLSGAIARLGAEVMSLCPQMKDRDDEDEIQQHFCFILADHSEDENTFNRMRVLEMDELALSVLSQPLSSGCLMVHTKDQTHRLQSEEESGTVPIQDHVTSEKHHVNSTDDHMTFVQDHMVSTDDHVTSVQHNVIYTEGESSKSPWSTPRHFATASMQKAEVQPVADLFHFSDTYSQCLDIVDAFADPPPVENDIKMDPPPSPSKSIP